MNESKGYLVTKLEQEIVEKCNAFGVSIATIYDFVRNPDKFILNEEIANLFAAELQKDHDKNFLAILMQASSVVKFRKVIMPSIVKIARREGSNFTGGDAINALGEIALPEDCPILGDLLCDLNVSRSRSLLIPIYARLAKKSGIPILRKIIHDPDTATYALHHLSILGDTSIEPELIELATHKDAWRRKIAKDALKRVEKNKAKLATRR